MKRILASLVLVAGLLLPVWLRSAIPSPPPQHALTLSPEFLANPARLQGAIAPFRLEEAWQLQSPSAGGYSALLALGQRTFWALSDDGRWLWLDLDHSKGPRHTFGHVHFADDAHDKKYHDVESATRDPASGTIWLGLEGLNAVVKTDRGLTEHARIAPALMRDWGKNSGPESLLRLTDGRFITIREVPRSGSGGRIHAAVLFSRDPTQEKQPKPFFFEGPRNFSAVDMTQLPDGRVLILMRRLIWVAPLRFAGRIVIADPRDIAPGTVWKSKEVAPLTSDMPIDNFEGIAATPGENGQDDVWLISDNNFMDRWQRTLLWRLSVDPKKLP